MVVACHAQGGGVGRGQAEHRGQHPATVEAVGQLSARDGQEHRRQGHGQSLPPQGQHVLVRAIKIDSHRQELDLAGHGHGEPTHRVQAKIRDPPRCVGVGPRRVGRRGRFGNGHAGGKWSNRCGIYKPTRKPAAKKPRRVSPALAGLDLDTYFRCGEDAIGVAWTISFATIFCMEKIPETPGRRGAVAIVVREGRMLVIRRSRHVIAPLTYCFPGGGIEDGETEETAVVREVHEEIGVHDPSLAAALGVRDRLEGPSRLVACRHGPDGRGGAQPSRGRVDPLVHAAGNGRPVRVVGQQPRVPGTDREGGDLALRRELPLPRLFKAASMASTSRTIALPSDRGKLSRRRGTY